MAVGGPFQKLETANQSSASAEVFAKREAEKWAQLARLPWYVPHWRLRNLPRAIDLKNDVAAIYSSSPYLPSHMVNQPWSTRRS
jgi:hypothetical protein